MNLRTLCCAFLSLVFASCLNNTVGPVASSGTPPPQFFLNQNYPNPFTDSTWIVYGVPSTGGQNSFVSLIVFDKLHNTVRTLAFNQLHPAGIDTLAWDGRDENYKRVPAGIYVIELYGASPNVFLKRITAVKGR